MSLETALMCARCGRLFPGNLVGACPHCPSLLKFSQQDLDEACRGAADKRAEEIAQAIEVQRDYIRMAPSALFIRQGLAGAREIARSFISPKSREAVLQEALLNVACATTTNIEAVDEVDRLRAIARRALEYTPDMSPGTTKGTT